MREWTTMNAKKRCLKCLQWHTRTHTHTRVDTRKKIKRRKSVRTSMHNILKDLIYGNDDGDDNDELGVNDGDGDQQW